MADSAPGTPVALQWSSVEHADTYRLEIVPVAGSGRAESFINDGWLCGSIYEPADFEPRWDGRARCAVRDVSRLPVDLYQWRVEALDSGGALIGSPSDWSYLIRR